MAEAISDVRHALLIDGARFYSKAYPAIEEFADAVLEAVRDAVEEELPSFSKAIGIPVSKEEIRPRKRFLNLNSSRQKLSLGVKIQQDQVAGCRHYFNLAWTADTLSANASTRFLDPSGAEWLAAAMRNPATTLRSNGSAQIGNDPNELWMSRTLSPEDMAQLQQIFRELIQAWCGVWRELGGLKSKVSKRTGRT
jgi:hypothetical protein